MTLSIAEIISEVSSILGASFRLPTYPPLRGGSHGVYVIEPEDGYNGKNRCCLRIPLDADAASASTKGTAILKIVKEKLPVLPIPAVIFQSEHYTVMEYLNGEVLKSWNTQSLTKERRRVLLDDLAALLFSLWTFGGQAQVTQGTEHMPTYREYLQNEVDRGLRRTLNGTSSWGHPMYYLYQRVKIDSLVPRPENAPIVATGIKHGDLNAWNVIVDKKGLSGVVDWDTARFVPAPAAIQHPLFIADIPGWRNDNVPGGMTFEEDRAYLEHAIGKLDTNSAPGSGSNSQTSGRIKHLLQTSFERQFFELSLHNWRINDEYIKRRLRFEDMKTNRNAALQQLDDFLSADESMRTLPRVIEVQNRLRNDVNLFEPFV
ncbi:hypothetical protein L228DRAFT_241891 [Xylona heveae TC161]|uniref:Aminoglycoside phosphotransferase domain-containing protein n=1 Tax=Xylona heveae (strain CBS 132557 / TC161) TaxID=1328760 RepID=A0A164ZKV7_XYLHT|nr:hypothetical protein L228DRAFT_241891 [Xylona heveae TC161]KZF19222.1 hypothetical protein L228DRAFT_241891 [Xylona heveae TC161]